MTALSLTLFAWCAAPSAFALDTGDIVVTSIKGDVRITVAGAPRPLKPGGVLETPATIRTGQDGSIELQQGATTVSVGPDTQLEFPALEKKGGAIDRIVQPRGNAFYSIGKREGRKLRVETPYLVGVIKGTQFNVAAQDAGTTISLFEGRLEVQATGGSDVIDLNAGEIASRKRSDKSINVMKMDGKVPTTAPRPTSSGKGGGNGNGNDGSSLLAGTAATGGDGVTDTRVELDATAPGLDMVAGQGAPAAALDVVGVSGNVDPGVTPGSFDVGAGAEAGPISAGIGVDAGVSAGPSNIDASAGTSTAIDTGVIGTDVNTNTAVDIGTGGLGAAVGAGAAVSLGNTTVVDTSTSAAVDVGANTSIGVNTNTTVAGVDTGVAAGVNTNAGTVDVGVNVGGINVNVGVDLGLDDDNNGHGDDAGHDDTSNPGTSTSSPTPPAPAPVIDVGGLLDGLVRHRRK